MPITFSADTSEGEGNFVFVRLLARWKGSLYKLVWVDLVIYMVLYYIINFIYRFALPDEHKRNFEEVVKFSDDVRTHIPISFVLGFFVVGLIVRWSQIYFLIPWLNHYSFLVNSYIIGGEPEKVKKVREVILRYLNLSWILLMRGVSEQIAKRFKQNDTSEESSVRDIFANFNKDRAIQKTYRKIITNNEIHAFENIAASYYAIKKVNYNPEYWVPLQWLFVILKKSFYSGYIVDPKHLGILIYETECLRGDMHLLQLYCSIMIPLVYTQVVIIAIYTYFLCELFSAQFVETKMKIPGHEIDLYVPIFTIIQFLFLMGWLKVAMCVMNPFGDDDEDFPTSLMLDENLSYSHKMASERGSAYPENLFVENQKNIGIEEFIEDVDGDLEEIDPPGIEDNVGALEYKASAWHRFQSIICCKFDSLAATMASSPTSFSKRRKKNSFFTLDQKVNDTITHTDIESH